MIKVGVIGLGQLWDTYKNVLPRLRCPPQVAVVFDLVRARAEQSVKEFDAKVALGIQSLAAHKEVEAILLMDLGWLGTSALELLIRSKKPVFVGAWMPVDAESLQRWDEASANNGMHLVPALWRRFMPATTRLMELAATELGAPQSLSLCLALNELATMSAKSEALLGWLDFGRYLFRADPSASSITHRSNSDGCHLRLSVHFPPLPTSGLGHPRELQINLAGVEDAEALRRIVRESDSSGPALNTAAVNSLPTIPRIEIQSTNGSGAIEDRATISWQCIAGTRQSENLAVERSEHTVMLDHFFRRVAGGLIPVAGYGDLLSSLRVIRDASDDSSI